MLILFSFINKFGYIFLDNEHIMWYNIKVVMKLRNGELSVGIAPFLYTRNKTERRSIFFSETIDNLKTKCYNT